MLHCRPLLLSSRKVTSSVHIFAHPHSVFCDHRPNNHCTPSWSPQTLLLRSRTDLFFSSSVSSECDDRLIVWVVVFLYDCSQGLWAAWSVCVHSSVADSHTVLQNVKTKTKAFQQEVWIMCRILRSVRMFETCSTVHAWNPCYAKHTPLKSTNLSLTSPFSNREHELFHRPPYLFTSSRCLMCSVQTGVFSSDITEKGIALGLCKPGCSSNNLLLMLFKTQLASRASTRSCGFPFYFDFSIVFACRCFCLFYSVVHFVW